MALLSPRYQIVSLQNSSLHSYSLRASEKDVLHLSQVFFNWAAIRTTPRCSKQQVLGPRWSFRSIYEGDICFPLCHRFPSRVQYCRHLGLDVCRYFCMCGYPHTPRMSCCNNSRTFFGIKTCDGFAADLRKNISHTWMATNYLNGSNENLVSMSTSRIFIHLRIFI